MTSQTNQNSANREPRSSRVVSGLTGVSGGGMNRPRVNRSKRATASQDTPNG